VRPLAAARQVYGPACDSQNVGTPAFPGNAVHRRLSGRFVTFVALGTRGVVFGWVDDHLVLTAKSDQADLHTETR
jgi:hypothetical protein